ncbi:hypothetical protein Tco_0877756 [Tanacetum coccineum]|uniref:Uncharacterized protein n=1 Tax=Tanacetum coccineum TaxID=301880 RepID=A0ABQ5BVY4_9ASTR
MSTLVNTSSTEISVEISVVKQKHDELLKKSLLTRSQFEGQLKEKSKVISDLKVKEGRDIDKMIEMDKQIKFLNEILYKRNQSIQTIHMLAPKCATYNGRSTFANPKYLKIAQSEKPRLYEIPYDTSDPANRFCPNGEETVTLEKESRSKLDKDSNTWNLLRSRLVKEHNIKWSMKAGILKTVMSSWIQQEDIPSSTTKVEGEPPNGSNTDIPHQRESEQALNVSAGTLLSTAVHASVVNVKWCLLEITLQAPFLNVLMTSVHISSGLVLHQITSDHNRSELGIQDHNNEQTSSKLVPKVVPLAVKTATSRQELELLFHHHIAMLRTTEHPSDTNVFTMKMEILLEPASNKLLVKRCFQDNAKVVKNKRSQDGKDDKDNDKGSKSRSQSMKEQAYNEDKDQEHSSLNDKSNLTDLMKECHQ